MFRKLPRRKSVEEEVKMYAVREIGNNIPFTRLSYDIDQVKKWKGKDCEIVTVTISPVKK